MPRLARKDYETNYFHIMVQGINKEYIFKNNLQIEEYIRLIRKYKEKYKLLILAYCIMNNHAHFLIYAKDSKELAGFMHKINMIYATYYNEINGRKGYVFRNRYKSEGIYKEDYLLNCLAYIHKNPLKANLVNRLEDYKFSSYNEYIIKKDIVTEEAVKLIFGGKDYIELFNLIHEEDCMRFEDVDEDKESESELLDIFLKSNKISLEEVKNKSIYLRKLVLYLKTNNGVSYRKIEKLIGIGREKLRKLI